ncbi:hypothetical protein J8273_3435 [Carpediemonas membranifera]|uniref:Uncharacterized protein n=1 Tax=Carpediemonas membranifera TaxID=201153 RepID=A0A8J6ASF9_9EUKA|nr:hypothetical protein J8273_3435 [Carpediemonas membranifera]|eukprot:KAG9393301.1 hypothetical protein J8273_3435 [Carpediemonas membranifera]
MLDIERLSSIADRLADLPHLPRSVTIRLTSPGCVVVIHPNKWDRTFDLSPEVWAVVRRLHCMRDALAEVRDSGNAQLDDDSLCLGLPHLIKLLSCLALHTRVAAPFSLHLTSPQYLIVTRLLGKTTSVMPQDFNVSRTAAGFDLVIAALALEGGDRQEITVRHTDIARPAILGVVHLSLILQVLTAESLPRSFEMRLTEPYALVMLHECRFTVLDNCTDNEVGALIHAANSWLQLLQSVRQAVRAGSLATIDVQYPANPHMSLGCRHLRQLLEVIGTGRPRSLELWLGDEGVMIALVDGKLVPREESGCDSRAAADG